MSKAVPYIINAFNAGVFSRRMDGRTDFAKYFSACRRMENFLAMRQGGAARRPGTVFAGVVAEHSRRHVLIPFDFDAQAGQSYMLELGHHTLRFWRPDGLVLSGSIPLSIATPWSEDQAPAVRYVQSADVMFLVHPETPPQKLTRRGHADWTLAAVQFKDGPWKRREPGDKDITLTPAARIGTVALDASANVFQPGHVGALVRLGYVDPSDSEAVQWGWATISQYSGPRSVACNIQGNGFGAQYLADPSFDAGFAGWADKSTAPASSISYDAASKRMRLNQGDAGYAWGEYAVDVVAGVQLVLSVDVYSATSSLRISVGTSSSGTQLLAWQALSPGVHVFNVTPTAGKIYLDIDTSGSSAGTSAINEVSLTRRDLSTNEWRMGAFSAVDGYPEDVTFHEQRLVLAKYRDHYLSRTDGHYEEHDFSTPAKDSDAVAYPILLDKVSRTRWMVSADDLLVGTNSAEVRVRAGTEGDPLSPKQPIKPQRQSGHGSGSVPAVLAGAQIVFISPTGRVVRDLGFNVRSYKYEARDITSLAEHVTGPGVVAMAFASEPTPILWAALANGSLIGCTYMPEQDVIAWHQHTLGGDGAVESLGVIPGDGYAQLWAVVRRTVEGQTRRYVEYLAPEFDASGQADARHAYYLDCGLSLNAWNLDTARFLTLAADAPGAWAATNTGTMTADGHTPFSAGDVGRTFFLAGADGAETRVLVTGYASPTVVAVSFSWPVPDEIQGVASSSWARAVSTVSGLGHLEGEAVDVLADGAHLGQRVVAGGALALGRPAAVVHVGLGFASLLQPMRLEMPGQGSALQSRVTSIPRATVRVVESVGGEVCSGDDVAGSYAPISVWAPGALAGQAPRLFSGDKEVNLSSDADKKGLLTIRQAAPLPLTVTCIIPTVSVS